VPCFFVCFLVLKVKKKKFGKTHFRLASGFIYRVRELGGGDGVFVSICFWL